MLNFFFLNSSRPFTFASDFKVVIIISPFKGLGHGVVGQIHIIYWVCIVDTASIDDIHVIPLARMSCVSGCKITSQPVTILGPSSCTTLVTNDNKKKSTTIKLHFELHFNKTHHEAYGYKLLNWFFFSCFINIMFFQNIMIQNGILQYPKS